MAITADDFFNLDDEETVSENLKDVKVLAEILSDPVSFQIISECESCNTELDVPIIRLLPIDQDLDELDSSIICKTCQ